MPWQQKIEDWELFNLVIDLGGTKARMALATQNGVVRDSIKDIPSAGYNSLEAAIMAYISMSSVDLIGGISVGIAGPVIDNKAEVTNLGWKVCAKNLKRDFGPKGVKSVALLNDLEAFAWGINALSNDSLHCVLSGTPTNIS